MDSSSTTRTMALGGKFRDNKGIRREFLATR
jgi:GTP cyclohydrolase I